MPNITEPEIPDNNHYYNNYNNTIKIVVDSANKEVFVNKNYDKKRIDNKKWSTMIFSMAQKYILWYIKQISILKN